MRRPLIAGNWKMHKTLAEARELVAAIRAGLETLPNRDFLDVLICPPFQLLFPMAKALAGSSMLLGAQNAHHESQGAFTGEVSVPMLKDTGCSHVIIGHSERRQLFREGDDFIARKVRSVVAAELTAIFCVGETLEERETGRTEEVIERQLARVLSSDLSFQRLVIAYEPVWAIGTGRTATPQQAQSVHAFIRSKLQSILDARSAGTTRILYGGSVKPDNAAGLLDQPDIDGALVGGACLSAVDFLGIISAAAALPR